MGLRGRLLQWRRRWRGWVRLHRADEGYRVEEESIIDGNHNYFVCEWKAKCGEISSIPCGQHKDFIISYSGYMYITTALHIMTLFTASKANSRYMVNLGMYSRSVYCENHISNLNDIVL